MQLLLVLLEKIVVEDNLLFFCCCMMVMAQAHCFFDGRVEHEKEQFVFCRQPFISDVQK